MFALAVHVVLLCVVDLCRPRQTAGLKSGGISEVGKNVFSILLFVFCVIFLSLIVGWASLMKNVLGTGVAMVLGLSQCQREYLPHLRFMAVHEAVQVGRGLSRVRVAD